MKSPTWRRPVEVSQVFFMDLAFLLIAVLVLLVRDHMADKEKPAEPGIEESASAILSKASPIMLRTSSIRQVVETNLFGESLFLEIDKSGDVRELVTANKKQKLSLQEVAARVEKMPLNLPRIVVLAVAEEVQYGKFVVVKDELEKLKDAGKINQAFELIMHRKSE